MKAGQNADKTFANAILTHGAIGIVTGPDYGVAEDVFLRVLGHIKTTTQSDSIAMLSEIELADNYDTMLERIEAQDLWGGKQVFGLRIDTERQSKKLINLLKTHDTRPLGNVLVILARKLARKGALFKAIEGAQNTRLMQCADDTADNLAATLKQVFVQNGVEIDDDALEILATTYLGDRNIALQEAEKLSLYALSLGRGLAPDDLAEVLAAKSDYAFRDLVYPTLAGDLAAVPIALNRLSKSGKADISILRALQNEVQRMIDVKLAQQSGARRPEMASKPPIFQKDWPDFQARLQKWPMAYLVRVLERIAECEARTRLDSSFTHALVLNLFCELAQTASHR